MLEKQAIPQSIIVRRQGTNEQRTVQPQERRSEERPKRYGKRFLTVRGKSIVADYIRDNTVNMYVIEEGTKQLLPVVENAPRDQARQLAITIATMMECYEKLAQAGHMAVVLSVSR